MTSLYFRYLEENSIAIENEKKQLIEALEIAITNKALRQEFGRNAKNSYESNFSSSIVFNKFNELVKIIKKNNQT